MLCIVFWIILLNTIIVAVSTQTDQLYNMVSATDLGVKEDGKNGPRFVFLCENSQTVWFKNYLISNDIIMLKDFCVCRNGGSSKSTVNTVVEILGYKNPAPKQLFCFCWCWFWHVSESSLQFFQSSTSSKSMATQIKLSVSQWKRNLPHIYFFLYGREILWLNLFVGGNSLWVQATIFRYGWGGGACKVCEGAWQRR